MTPEVGKPNFSDAGAPLLALLTFVTAVVVLFFAKGYPGPWVTFFDDGAWVAIVRHWCEGARLYTDVIDLKPPGFFLYMRPMCWVSPSVDLQVNWEPLIFWMPIFVGYGCGLVLIVRGLALIPASAAALGLLTGALIFTNRSGSFFASEHPAACFAFLAAACAVHGRSRPRRERRWHFPAVALLCAASVLCNTKFLPFAALYFFIGRFSAKEFLRDLALGLTLGVVVAAVAMGLEWKTFQFLWMASKNYWPFPLSLRLENFFLTGLFDPHYGIMAPGEMLFGWLGNSDLAQFLNDWMGITALLALGGFICARGRHLLIPFFGSCFAIIQVGTVWCHTLVQLFPIIVLVAAQLLLAPTLKARRVATGVIVLVSLLSLRFDWVDYGFYTTGESGYFRKSADRTMIAEGKQMARIFQKHVGGKPWVSLMGNATPLWLTPGAARPRNVQYHNYCWASAPWMERNIREALRATGPFMLVGNAHIRMPGCSSLRMHAMLDEVCTKIEEVPSFVSSSVEFYSCSVNRVSLRKPRWVRLGRTHQGQAKREPVASNEN